MIARTALAALSLGVLTGALTACDTAPEPPEPTPPFATEEQAFEAAEATYRAYVDALNGVDLSNPETFEEVYAWTTGEANANERVSLSTMHADGWVVAGESIVGSINQVRADPSSGHVVIETCLDVSEVTVADDRGVSVVSPSRPTAQASRVSMSQASTKYGLAIATISSGSHPC